MHIRRIEASELLRDTGVPASLVTRVEASSQMQRRRFLPLLGVPLTAASCGLPFTADNDQQEDYDVVVYGGTVGGILAAISAVRAGASVVVLEPTEKLRVPVAKCGRSIAGIRRKRVLSAGKWPRRGWSFPCGRACVTTAGNGSRCQCCAQHFVPGC